jgi:hypothetical protein
LAKSSGFEVETMTNEERTEALQSLGYHGVEARFLCLAALHSGYFLRRQFLSFVAAPKGWRDDSFTEKLISRRHCQATAYRHNRMVYRLCSKPFFAALGEPDNRNRRQKQPVTIKNKLMALDFVLEHRDLHYLATETEKVEYFTTIARVPLENLPVKRYQSLRNGQSTLRYFIEKFPIFVTGSDGKHTVNFCYVDEGVVSTDGFETFLSHYQSLFSALTGCCVVYLAAQPNLLEKAGTLFHTRNGRKQEPPADPLTRDLLAYFEMRRRYEARDFSGFNTARIVRYREQKRRFADFGFDDLYQRWLLEGDAAVLRKPSANGASSHSLSSPVVRFDTYLLRHNYDLFGTL